VTILDKFQLKWTCLDSTSLSKRQSGQNLGLDAGLKWLDGFDSNLVESDDLGV
jgi:hypothetical protein